MVLTFQVHKNCCHYKEICEPHFHDDYELLLCLTDGGTFLINNHAYPLCHGMLFVLGKNVLHQCIADISDYEKYIVHFTADTLSSISGPRTDFVTLFNAQDYFSVLLNEDQFLKISHFIEACLVKESAFASDIQQDIAFVQLILGVSELLHTENFSSHAAPNKEYAKIMPIIEYVHEHYDEDIGLGQISQLFFISKYYLCRLFKEVTGFSVGAYITNYRIRQACVFLRQGKTVQEAGEAVGLGNSANFIRTFRKIMGTPPGKYAKSY